MRMIFLTAMTLITMACHMALEANGEVEVNGYLFTFHCIVGADQVRVVKSDTLITIDGCTDVTDEIPDLLRDAPENDILEFLLTLD